MNCSKCGYLLFGVSSGRCPECGVMFAATDFSFPRGSVHFLCPQCQQGYIGADEYGLPFPRAFRCVKCETPIRAADMAVRPIREGVLGESLRFGSPWDHRARLGAIRSFALTLTGVCTRPGEFFRSSFGTDRGGAIVFAVLAALMSQVVWMPFVAALNYLYPIFPALTARQAILQFIAWLLVFAGAWAVWIHVYAYSICLTLWTMGAQEADMDSAVHVTGFATAVLPVPPIGLIWYFLVVVRGIRELFQTTAMRAWIAGAMLPLVLINLVVLWKIL